VAAEHGEQNECEYAEKADPATANGDTAATTEHAPAATSAILHARRVEAGVVVVLHPAATSFTCESNAPLVEDSHPETIARGRELPHSDHGSRRT
jgi:hypothetical protein